MGTSWAIRETKNPRQHQCLGKAGEVRFKYLTKYGIISLRNRFHFEKDMPYPPKASKINERSAQNAPKLCPASALKREKAA
jgi:hypothetical protein